MTTSKQIPNSNSTLDGKEVETAYVWVWLPGAIEPVVSGALKPVGDLLVFQYGKSYLGRKDAIPL